MNDIKASSSSVGRNADPETTLLEDTYDEELLTTNDDRVCDGIDEDEGDPDSHRLGILRSAATQFPRLYHIFVGVILRVFVLIGLSLLFGYVLARFESTGEIEGNDLKMRQLYKEYNEYVAAQEEIRSTIETVPLICLGEFDDNATLQQLKENNFQLLSHLGSCSAGKAQEYYATLSASDYFKEFVSLLSFDWISCPREEDIRLNIPTNNATSFDQAMQTEYYGRAFDREFVQLTEQYSASGLDKDEAVAVALDEATGSADCKIHFAGGAFFWFTVMTTIGYGHASVVTDAGRSLIFSFGFVSIIAFTALIGQAAHITLAIVDDAFRQSKWLRPLAKGFPAVLFWFLVLVLWILFDAHIYRTFVIGRYGVDDLDMFLWKDAVWFSYISLTTVGFGDIHLPHEEFVTADMFYLPLLFLIGFVFLANFGLKLGKFLLKILPKGETIDELLEQQRRRKRKQKQQR